MDKELRVAKGRALRRVLLVILVIAIVLPGALIGCDFVQRYNRTTDLAAMAPVREMIKQATEDTKADAPIDPKTGDIYFPPAKLYLPNASTFTRLTYAYDQASNTPLSIANRTLTRQNLNHLYNAQDINQLFAAVPHHQACQRGITLSYQLMTEEGKELRQTISLDNGKSLYLYAEKACPELSETLDLLKNLKAY